MHEYYLYPAEYKTTIDRENPQSQPPHNQNGLIVELATKPTHGRFTNLPGNEFLIQFGQRARPVPQGIARSHTSPAPL